MVGGVTGMVEDGSGGGTPQRFLARFPCASIASPFVSIGSVPMSRPTGAAGDIDAAFARALRRGPALKIAAERAHDGAADDDVACRPDLNAMRAWLERVVAPAGVAPVLGAVPVNVRGLRAAPGCVRIASGAPGVAYVEFVVHRYGDPKGHHYACQVSVRPPYALHAFRRVGAVSSDAIWSIEHE